jgi:hypothetical protein
VRTTDVDSICHGGSTKQYRPPSSYTNTLKRQQLIAYGYPDTDPSHYEEDHLVALEIGLHRQVCSGAMTPEEAQRGISTDWRQYLPQVSGTKTRKYSDE